MTCFSFTNSLSSVDCAATLQQWPPIQQLLTPGIKSLIIRHGLTALPFTLYLGHSYRNYDPCQGQFLADSVGGQKTEATTLKTLIRPLA